MGSGADYREDAINLDRFLDSDHHVGETAPPDVLADAHHLPFSDGCLDAVRASHVLEHLEAPLDALVECHRVLRAGGTVYVEVPYPDRTPAERDDHLYSWTEDTLHNITRRAGFEVIEYERHEHAWPNTVGKVHHVAGRKP